MTNNMPILPFTVIFSPLIIAPDIAVNTNVKEFTNGPTMDISR
jgi:hypothetical protein